MASPWFDINVDCANAINAEVRNYLHDEDVAARCRRLTCPVLIIDGARDRRPRWAVDSLEQALPIVDRVTLADAGHMPWAEDPEGFRRAVACFLTRDDHASVSR